MTKGRNTLLAIFIKSSLLLTVVILATSCGSGTGEKEPKKVLSLIEKIVVATSAQGSSEIGGELRTGGSIEPVSGRWSRAGASGDIGAVTSSLHIRGEARLPLEIRWVGGTVYFERDNRIGGTAKGLGIYEPVARRVEFDSEWGSFTSGTAIEKLAAPFIPFDPLRLLELVESRGATLKVVGDDSDNLTQYNVEGLSGGLLFFNAPEVDIWVNSDNRLARVRVMSGDEWLDYSLENFGVDVSVEPPSAEQLKQGVDPGEIVLAEPFDVEVEGETEGIQWALSRGRSTAGFDCWRITPAEQIVVKAPNGPEGSRCLAAISPDDDLADQAVFLITTTAESPLAALVVGFPVQTKTATVGFIGGELRKTAVANGVLSYVGDDVPLFLSVELGGVTVECGAGSVSKASDLRDPTVTNSSIGNPWVCATV